MRSNFDRTSQLLESYRLNVREPGCNNVRDMILVDIRRFSEMGADAYVADLRKALFRFDDEACGRAYSAAAYHRADTDRLSSGM